MSTLIVTLLISLVVVAAVWMWSQQSPSTKNSTALSNSNLNTALDTNFQATNTENANIQSDILWETLVAQSTDTASVRFESLRFEIPKNMKRTDSEGTAFFTFQVDAPESPYISFTTSSEAVDTIMAEKKRSMSESETVVRESAETFNGIQWKMFEQTTDFGVNQVTWVASSDPRVVIQYAVMRNDVTAVFEKIIRSGSIQ